MNRGWWYRCVFLLVISVAAIMTVIPTITNMDTEKSSFPVKSKINLGLDLQGGLYMVLGIDFDKVYKDEIATYMLNFISYAKENGSNISLGDMNVKDPNDPKQIIEINGDPGLAKDLMKKYSNSYLRLTSEKGSTLEYGLAQNYRYEIEQNAVKKSIEVIRNRIDEFGVTEPEIISQGKDRIVVQLPGVKDIARAKELIGKTAKLEFKMVNDSIGQGKLEEWVEKTKKAKIEFKKGERFSTYLDKVNEFLKADIPKGYTLAFEKVMNPANNEIKSMAPYLVERVSTLTGDELQDARVSTNPTDNMPYVSIEFKSKGAKLFETLTEKGVGKRMAIVLDGNIYSAPVINEKIGGGRAQITLGRGNRNDVFKQAIDLALILRAGALPVELIFEEQRIVGPSLGADSIEKSKLAGLIGAGLVFLFIMFYYKISGVLAIKTLVLNLIFVLAALVGLEATLTLPGIAGIALTIGMAVDANIIIFERIKEELRIGTPIREAVETGFSRAFWTILDSNLTTAAAGLCLINFGTGPIRGFAVTLLIGIAATVYTAYFVGKLYFEFYMNRTHGKALSI